LKVFLEVWPRTELGADEKVGRFRAFVSHVLSLCAHLGVLYSIKKSTADAGWCWIGKHATISICPGPSSSGGVVAYGPVIAAVMAKRNGGTETAWLKRSRKKKRWCMAKGGEVVAYGLA